VVLLLKKLAIYCSDFGIKHFPGYLEPLKNELRQSNSGILYEIYVGRMILVTVMSFLIVFGFVFGAFLVFNIPPIVAFVSALLGAMTLSVIILTLYHSYPFHLITSKRNSIESNMPFAINHISAIATSGVPPFVMFKLLSSIVEYGQISKEARRIVRNVETFGMDINTAIKNVSETTPSTKFSQFLSGITSTIETGGDIRRYLDSASKEALFEYRLIREKYIQTLSTYADFYTAVLIAAPLFFISTLSVMSLVGGSIFGLSIPNAIKIGVYVFIPLLNTVFIAFIHYTQPNV
jgi:archaeal flagellar protein FlaJ